MSIPAQAANAWGRHLARNSSVLADLFQGQVRSVTQHDTFYKWRSVFQRHFFIYLSICLTVCHV